jgi:two-component system response regulator TctD
MSMDVSPALATVLAGDEVPLLRWPAQEAERQRLAAAGKPRLLLLTADQPPPVDWDELEDWIREPVDLAEMEVRRHTVHSRARLARRRPWFDDAGLLRVGDDWVDLSPGQVPIARLLVDRLDRVVRREELVAACAAAGVSTHATALKAAVGRLERRLAPVGLRLRSIRGRGYLLELTDPLAGPGTGADPSADPGGDGSPDATNA